jgi:anti-sigma-K factor RskA
MEAPPPSPPASGNDPEDEIIAALLDYHEGVLGPERRAEVEAKLASDARWRQIDAELREEPPPLAKLGKVAAPEALAAAVTETIHRRSAGRFFGKRSLGDRLPAGALLVIAALLLGAMTLVWCRSTTGSLRSPRGTEEPKPAPAESLAPTP